MKSKYEKPYVSITIEVIRPAEIADVKAIEHEVNLSVWSAEDYVNELKRPDSICLAAKNHGKVVGFAVARLITITDTLPRLNEAELLNLAITKSLQNQNIGSKLLASLTETLKSKNVLRIWLEVRESNRQALKFYEKHGFREKFRRRNYYPLPREDALVLCRELRQ